MRVEVVVKVKYRLEAADESEALARVARAEHAADEAVEEWANAASPLVRGTVALDAREVTP